jgi:Zn-finger nucleic acid-binding protein
MSDCNNCSAPLPANSIICDYCGTRNDTDLKGVHKYTVQQPDSKRICPRCNISMKTIDMKIEGKFLIERCPDCLGLFFDINELETLLKASVKNVYDIQRHKINELNKSLKNNDYTASYIKCPVCSKLMRRVNFGAKSGVIIDKCSEHGIWLDGGELRHLLEWVKAGGQILAKQRDKIKKRDAARFNETKNRGSTTSMPIGSSDFNHYGSTLRTNDPDVFSIISKVANWLIR